MSWRTCDIARSLKRMKERKGADKEVRQGKAALGKGGSRAAAGAAKSRTGPRGGTTTLTDSGMVKKNLWIPWEVAEGLRQKAFDERRSEADIIREGLERLLDGK